MPYSEIFASAGRLLWKFKVLWLFGLLASCSSGGVRLSNPFTFNFNTGDVVRSNGQLPEPIQNFLLELGRRISDLSGGGRLDQNWVTVLGLAALLVCSLGLIGWLIGTFGRSGLALGAWQGDAGAAQLEPGALNQAVLAVFWRVAAISLLVGLPGMAVALIFALIWGYGIVSLLSQAAPAVSGIFLCLSLPLMCGMLPLFWMMGILSELATVAVVGEGLGVWAGLKRAWALFQRNLGALLLMGVFVLALQVLAGVVTGLVLAPLGIGLLLGGVVLGEAMQGSLALLVGLFLILAPIALAFSAGFNAYSGTLWVLVFRRLAGAAGGQGSEGEIYSL